MRPDKITETREGVFESAFVRACFLRQLCMYVFAVCAGGSSDCAKCPEEPRRASYGVMSGLIRQPCLRLITHRPFGEGNREKRKAKMKRPHRERSPPSELHLHRFLNGYATRL